MSVVDRTEDIRNDPDATHALVLEADGRAFLIDLTHPTRRDVIRPDRLTFIEQLLATSHEARRAVDRAGDSSNLASLCDSLSSAPGLPAVVGVDLTGRAVTLDLVADGPHVLVAGPTGSGKTEFLVTLAMSLCAYRTPREVSIVILDFKGGGGFARLTDLPHCRGLATDLHPDDVARALTAVATQLARRERLLADMRVTDVAGVPEESRPPRLVILVDEYRALIDRVPAARGLLADVVARGRALGVHVIAATQRATGTFSDDLVVNAPTRVCLGAVSSDDAWHLLGERTVTHRGPFEAVLRRAGEPLERLRAVMCDEETTHRAASMTRHEDAPLWWPALPTRVLLGPEGLHVDDTPTGPCVPAMSSGDRGKLLARVTGETSVAGAILGLSMHADTTEWRIETIEMRAGWHLSIQGSSGSGRSAMARLVAHQSNRAVVWLSSDPTHAWQQLRDLTHGSTPGRAVIADNLDALMDAFGSEFGDAAQAAWRDLIRQSDHNDLCVVTTHGQTSRYAEGANETLILAGSFAFPGPAHRHVTVPPGRGVFRGREFQAILLAADGDAPRGSTVDELDAGLPGVATLASPDVACVVSARPRWWIDRGWRAVTPDEWSTVSLRGSSGVTATTVIWESGTRQQARLGGLVADSIGPLRRGIVTVFLPDGSTQVARVNLT